MTTIEAPPATTAVASPAVIPNGNIVRQEALASYTVKRCFFPSHGRVSRRVNHRLENGQQFIGFIPACWWGPFCAFLVYGNPPPRS